MPKSKKEVEPLTPQEEAGLPNDVDPTVSYTDPELGGDDATGPGDTPGSHTDSELDEMTAAREAELSAGLVQEGDQFAIDVPNASVQLLVSDEELAARKAAYVQPEPNITTGWLSRYARMVTSADEGAVLR